MAFATGWIDRAMESKSWTFFFFQKYSRGAFWALVRVCGQMPVSASARLHVVVLKSRA